MFYSSWEFQRNFARFAQFIEHEVIMNFVGEALLVKVLEESSHQYFQKT